MGLYCSKNYWTKQGCNYNPMISLAKLSYVTNLDFPEIAGVPFPFLNATVPFGGPKLVFSVAII